MKVIWKTNMELCLSAEIMTGKKKAILYNTYQIVLINLWM